jgi:NADH-quinone oxidoreductase subunit I
VLDRFAIDYSLCMYCSICVEVCPFDALHWSPESDYVEHDIRDLTHERPRLGEWMLTVPPQHVDKEAHMLPGVDERLDDVPASPTRRQR